MWATFEYCKWSKIVWFHVLSLLPPHEHSDQKCLDLSSSPFRAVSLYFQVHHLPQDRGDQEQFEPCLAVLYHPCSSTLQWRLRQVRWQYRGQRLTDHSEVRITNHKSLQSIRGVFSSLAADRCRFVLMFHILDPFVVNYHYKLYDILICINLWFNEE